MPSNDHEVTRAVQALDQAERDAQLDATWREVRGPLGKCLAVLMIIGWLAFILIETGLLSSGRERRRVSFEGFSSSKRGFSMGNKQVYVANGRSIVLDYALIEGQGSLAVMVAAHQGPLLLPDINQPALWRQSVQTPGRWNAVIPVPHAGFYRIYVTPYPLRNTSMLYDINWHVQ